MFCEIKIVINHFCEMENFKQLNTTLENLPSSQAKIHKVFISFMQFEKPRQPHVKGGPLTEIEVIESLPYINILRRPATADDNCIKNSALYLKCRVL